MSIIDEERPSDTLPERLEQVAIAQQGRLLQLGRDQIKQVHNDEARNVFWCLQGHVGSQGDEVARPDAGSKLPRTCQEHFNRCAKVLNGIPRRCSSLPVGREGLVEEERRDVGIVGYCFVRAIRQSCKDKDSLDVGDEEPEEVCKERWLVLS